MNDSQRQELIDSSWAMHARVEESYREHPAGRGDSEWLEKQRLLLADMALHLLQTSLKPGDISTDRLRDNIHAVLTISDQFLPGAGLKRARDTLYRDVVPPSESAAKSG